MSELQFTPSYPLFCRPDYPGAVPILGGNGTVYTFAALAPFFGSFPSSEIHWCYRGPRSVEVPIPPIVDLPADFIPQYAIFSWTFQSDVRVYVEADERGIFIGSVREKHLICITPARVFPDIQVHVVPFAAMEDAARQIMSRFFPQGLVRDHQ